MKIIVACSGGPDSMALLDMLRKENKELAVAHVNYQKRDTAFRDENIVKAYCEQYGIPVHVLRPVKKTKENFQAWARDVRYRFFEEVCDMYKTKKLYVAHQQDDVIETYVFQKNRNMICDTYGISACSIRNGYEIIRPLLSYTKNDLMEYCESNGISYGIDETNLEDHYTRNQIRHSYIDTLSKREKNDICKEIEFENQKLTLYRNEMKLFFENWTIDELLEKKDNWLYLDYYLSKFISYHFSKGHLLDLCEKLKKDCLIELEGYELERYHDELTCTPKKQCVHDIYNFISYGTYDDYEFKDTGITIEGITLKENDFPICVRTVQENDEIHLRFGTKKVHRFFIDRKIPKHIRKYWLVVENKDKKVIFVPEIGCDVEHFSVKPNLFMVKYKL